MAAKPLPPEIQLQFYGQFETPVDKFIFERYFPDLGIKGTFIECGAFDGVTECSCKFFEESMGWRGINLEPVPHIFTKLAENRPTSENLNVGLSDRTRSVHFQAVEHPRYGLQTTIGAIEHSPEFREALRNDGCTFHDLEINVISWPDLIDRAALKSVDLMVLDVEGHELAVLSGMKNHPVLPHIMCVEFGHVGFDVLRAVMDDIGYEYDVSSYANAFFIRRDKLPLFTMRAKTGAVQSEIPKIQEKIDLLKAQIAAMEMSTSWRITAPLRSIKALFSRAIS